MTTRPAAPARVAALSLLLAITLVAACSGVAPLGRAEPEVPREPVPAQSAGAPRFWSWQEPLGMAARDPRIVKMVRVRTNRSPEGVADAACAEIVRRRLRAGEVCICLQNFGMGDGGPERKGTGNPALFQNDGDALPAGTCDSPWLTVWMSRGVAECRAWMDRFIARYALNQAREPRIPDPFRFHFDSEGRIQPHRRRAAAMGAFDAMRRDPRWATEIIPGSGGRTLAALYAEAGAPAYRADRPDGAESLAWVSWYARVANEAAEGAMNEAAYEPIRRAWRTCKSSNFGSSARFDGQGAPPRLDRAPRNPEVAFATNASADLQAPVLYWTQPEMQARLGGSVEEATLRRAEEIVDANVMSFGGPHDDVTPWIFMLGHRGESRGRPLVVTAPFMKAMLEMLRAKGVREFLLWSDASTQEGPGNWNALVGIIDEVWAARE
jgi:hypothetical protein